jgi:hypothetical protein
LTNDFSGFYDGWFGYPPATTLLGFRVWVLCGKKSAARTLGIPLTAAH